MSAHDGPPDGTSELEPLTPGDLLKQVAMPGWRELHMTQINLRDVSSRRFAACAIDAWRRPSDALGPRNSSEQPSRARGPRLIRRSTGGEARPRIDTRGERRPSSELTGDDMKLLRSMHDSIEGKLAYATSVIAADIDRSSAWADTMFVAYHDRIDLCRQVTDVVRSARMLLDSKERLVQPSGTLADDVDVMAIFDRRVRRHEERLAAIALRVQAFLRYREHVRSCEPILEKRAWIAAHSVPVDDDVEYVLEAKDQLAGDELSRATEEVESRTRAALDYLMEDARRLSSMLS